MAFNFNSGQFNDATSPPSRLGNMGVPRWSPTEPRPVECRPDPKPICDYNGHFLPGAPRGTSKCFGHFTGTWDLPRKFTKEVVAALQKEPPPGRFTDWVRLRVQRPGAAEAARKAARMRKKQSGQPPIKQQSYSVDAEFFKDQVGNDYHKETEGAEIVNNLESNREFEESQNKTDTKVDAYDPLDLFKKKKPVDPCGNTPYIPGSLTEPDQRHDSYDLLVKDAVEKIHGPQENETDKFWRKVAENAAKDDNARQENMIKLINEKSQALKLPQVNVAQNFQFARRMHVGNLEHQPLPDTLGYRNLTKIAEHRDSDIVVKPYAIGWKGYGASGPTCCTKMRVHRPKTCDPNKADGGKDDGKRPSTTSLNLGRQYKKPLSLMDLAICWDFRPEDLKCEPKPPKHIDGSNGSKAPAVFTMVHTPKDEIEDHVHSHFQPIFTQNRVANDVGRHSMPYFEKDLTKEKRKDSCDVQYCPQHNGRTKKENTVSSCSSRSSAHSNGNGKPQCDGIHGCGTLTDASQKSSNDADGQRPDKLQPIKDAWNGTNESKHYDINRNRQSLESYEKTPLAQGKLQQSSPKESNASRRSTKDSNLTNSTKHKTCLSCNGAKIPREPRQKEEYKAAFKAGNPNSHTNSNSSTDSKGVKIPKMRHPYSKKTYTIPTLTAPFSIWRDADATGYPEHWRLASVYQHAYKPPEQRRKPLISSVYQ